MWWNPFGSTTNTTATSRNTDFASEASPVPEQPQVTGRPLSREEQASADLDAFLKEIEIESSNAPSHRSQAAKAVPTTAPITESTLYPTEMSCRSSLDYAMFCQSFGGQFVNVYRYGSFRSCSNHWSDFWLCMRTRNWDEVDKKKAISDHYRKKDVKYKVGNSSEDVWDVRQTPVTDAFQESLEDLEEKIAIWRRDNPGVEEPQGGSGTLIKEVVSKG